jgi:hypothetical protein
MANYVPMAWDRWPKESDKAYEAFKVYLELGVKRTYKAASDAIGKDYNQVRDWAIKWEWKDRAVRYDTAMNQTAMAGRQNLVIKVQQMVIDDASYDYHAVLTLWRKALDKEELTLTELEQLVRVRDMIDKMGRRVAELPTTYKVMAGQKDAVERPAEKQLEWGNAEIPMLVDGHLASEGDDEQDSDTDED